MTSQEARLRITGTEKYELPLLVSMHQVVLKLNWRRECESWFIKFLKYHPKLRYFPLLPSLALPSKSMGELREMSYARRSGVYRVATKCGNVGECTIAGLVI